ncbi:AAA family ATPase [Nocardia sp. NPDC050712]|uniref:AAA family ATPase n=1 Tax=Nocardia sp. NPDC050712 TaxID=3155518 RepID=UPI0033FCD434
MNSSRGSGRLQPSPRTIFSHRFAELFEAAGNPTLRRVAAAAEARMRATRAAGQKGGVSIQRISDWKAGRNVPAKFESLLPVVLTLIDEARKSSTQVAPALLSAQEWQRLWTAAIEWDPDSAATECPYLGLTAYGRADAELFFGRSRPTAEFVELIRATVGPEGQGGIVMLVGASGAGKSSLLEAGVIPELGQPEEDWEIATLTPGAEPVAALLAAAAGSAVPDLPDDRPPTADTVTHTLSTWGTDRRRLLIIDQFEELFTLCHDDDQRETFLAALEDLAIRGEREPTAVVLAVRADFYARCVDIPVLEDALKHRSYLLGPMRLDELAEAITRPAELAGYKLESGLEELVISELCGLGTRGERRAYDPGALPLVSHVMAAVWERRDGMRLTIDGYEQAGGVIGSVAATAEKAWGELSEFQQSVGKQVLLGLVAVGDDSRDTRRKVARADLVRQTVEATEAALDVLARTRLITLDTESAYLTHEIVLDAWPRLRSWIDEDRVGYLERQRLQADASDWAGSHRDPSLLYRGARLTTMQEHADRGTVGTVAEEFLEAARAGRRRAERRSLALRSALALLTVVALALAGVAFVQSGTAKEQRDNAIFAALLAEADRLESTDSSLSAQLAMVANELRPGDPQVLTRLLNTQNLPLATSLSGHSGYVNALAFRPDGQVLASAGADGSLRLWTVTDHAPGALGSPIKGDMPLESVAFSPDGTTLAAASVMGTRLWDVRDPEHPRQIGSEIPGARMPALVAFSPDQQVLATGNKDGGVSFWDIANPADPRSIRSILSPESRYFWSALVLSSDFGRAVTIEADSEEMLLWDISQPGPARRLGYLSERGLAAVFSPDGNTVAVNFSGNISGNSALQIWDVRNEAEPRPIGTPLPGQVTRDKALAFSRDGKELVNAIAGGHLGVWEIDDFNRLSVSHGPLTGSKGVVTAAVFAPRGNIVATGGQDGMVRLWSLPQIQTRGPHAWTSRPELDAKGRIMAVGYAGFGIELWLVEDPHTVRRLGYLPTDYYPSHLTMSPDGRLLIADTGRSTTRLIDISDPAAPRNISEIAPDGAQLISAGVFSPDSRYLVTSQVDEANGHLQVWDVSNPRRPAKASARIALDSDYSNDIRVSPNGKLLATAGRKGSLMLWDFQDPAAPKLLGQNNIGPAESRGRLAFHPDGKTLVSTGDDQLIRVWDVGNPAAPRPVGLPLAGHTSPIATLAFDESGDRLVTGGIEDSMVRLWDFTDPRHPNVLSHPLATPASSRRWNTVIHPSGRYVVGTNNGNQILMWDLDPHQAITRICEVTGSLMTPELWQAHLPQLAYEPPCG